MNKYLVCILLLFGAVTLRAQQASFPDGWIGNWKGTLTWWKTGSPDPQSVRMEIRIGKGDSAGLYQWQISYGDSAKDVRPYVLKPVDAANGHWVIDEKNGIVLDQFLRGNQLSGAFSLENVTLVNTYRLDKDFLEVEFVSMSRSPLNHTGEGTEESPRVDTYRILATQRAILSRNK